MHGAYRINIFSRLLHAAVLLAALAGCRATAPKHADAAPTRSIRTSHGLTVQTNPQYRQAVSLFEKGNSTAAKAALDTIIASPNLSTADRDFLNRQISICDAKLRLPSPSGRGAGGEGGDRKGGAQLRRASPDPAAPLGDCGPRALQIIFRKLGRETTLQSLTKDAGTTKAGTSLEGLAKAAEAQGFKAEGIQVNLAALKELQGPAVAWTNGNHYVAVLKVDGDAVTIHDPNHHEQEVIATEELLKRSGGILLTVSRK